MHCFGHILLLLVYVDVIFVMRSSSSSVERTPFDLKDLGSLNYFLGIQVANTSSGVVLYQHKYIMDLLAKVSMTNAKPIATSMVSYLLLSAHSGSLFEDLTLYR